MKKSLPRLLCCGILDMQSGKPAVVSRKHLLSKYPPWCGVLVNKDIAFNFRVTAFGGPRYDE